MATLRKKKFGYRFSASLTYLLTLTLYVASHREMFINNGLIEGFAKLPFSKGVTIGVLLLVVYSLFRIIYSLIRNFKEYRKVFYVEVLLGGVLLIFTLISIHVMLAGARELKITPTIKTLYSSDIVNKPLRQFIEESFIPLIQNPANREMLEACHRYIIIDSIDTNSYQVQLLCQDLPVQFISNEHQKLFKSYKFANYTTIDNLTFEIYSNTKNGFIKATYGRNIAIEYNGINQLSTPKADLYMVTLEFEGDSLLSYDVINNLKLIEPASVASKNIDI